MNRANNRSVLCLLAVFGVVMSACADYFWSYNAAKTNGWFAADNTANAADGSWWKNDDNWGAAPTNEEGVVVKVNNGGTCVLSNDISSLKGRLFVAAGKGSATGTMIINDGAVIDGLGVCVSGPASWYPGSGSLVINGGNLTFGGGPAGYVYGLQVGYANKAGSVGTLEINGGTVTIAKGSFYTGTVPLSRGEIHVNGGTVTSQVGLTVGRSGTEPYEDLGLYEQKNGTVSIASGDVAVLSGGRMNLLGGTFAVSDNSLVGNGGVCYVGPSGSLSAGTVYVYNDGELEVTGGTFNVANVLMNNAGPSRGGSVNLRSGTVTVSGTLAPAKGGTVRVAMPLAAADVGAVAFGEGAGVTNTIAIVKGGSVTRNGASGLNFGESAPARQRLLVTDGGAYTNLASMTPGRKNAFIEVSHGGIFHVSHNNTNWGNLAPGNYPYYLRIKGEAEVSAGCYATGVSTFENQRNVIMEHVIDGGVVSPIVTRNDGSTGGTTKTCGGACVPGNQRLRPEGGVQVVSTNRFALFHSLNTNCKTFLTNEYWYTSAPDATLWTTDNLCDNHWGSTLNPSAKIALARGAWTKRVTYASEPFAARPMGYCELPRMNTNGLAGVTVALSIAAPEGGTLAGTLANVKAGLEAAGYANVETDGVTGLTTFDVPLARIAEKSADQKLLLDFTETPMPATGMVPESTALHYAYPTVTNALFTAVSVVYEKPIEGMLFLIR